MKESPPFVSQVLVLVFLLFYFLNLKHPELIYVFGFVPAFFRPYTLFTYSLIHPEFSHFLFNALFLFLAGFILEKRIGSTYFFLLYIFCGCISAMWDSFGRIVTGIPLILPLVGASGCIFGILTFSALFKPNEKIPGIFVVFPVLSFLVKFLEIKHTEVLTIFFNLVAFFTLIVAIVLIFCVFKTFLRLLFLPFIFLISWLPSLFTFGCVSNFGHLGGAIGGIIMFLVYLFTSGRSFNES